MAREFARSRDARQPEVGSRDPWTDSIIRSSRGHLAPFYGNFRPLAEQMHSLSA